MGKFHKIVLVLGIIFAVFYCTSCGKSQDVQWNAGNHDISTKLCYEYSMELEYATEFAVDYYSDGFILISISDGSRFLLNTRKEDIPKDLNSDIVVLDGFADNIYLVASATMDMFDAIDALDHISLSGTSAENWYIENAKQAMEAGTIQYAGKYSAPDYELILSTDCGLAIESTMILHSPEVKEKLEGFNIPVLVDYSSYESHPLGRTEWVKLYGVLTGKEEQAEAAFVEQENAYRELGEVEATGKTVVFFYITSNETVVVRKTNDYVSKMIELAGGTYLFSELTQEDNAASSVNMQMEEFYAKAKDADYLVYNSTIDGELTSIDELLEKSEFLKDFKAVQKGNVWCTTQNVYQQSMNSGKMIEEFHNMLTAEDTDEENENKYLFQLQ